MTNEYAYENDRLLHTLYCDGSSAEAAPLNSYVYDKQGNLAEVTNHPSGKKYYLAYDFLDRLMRVRDNDGNIYEYTYDVNNQMTRMKHVTASGSAVSDYTYDGDGRETAVVSGGNGRYTTYDTTSRRT